MPYLDPILYYKPSCPYCKKVFEHMQKLGVSVRSIDISQDEATKLFLKEKGGKVQVPCLLTKEGEEGEKLMYESSVIMEWVVKNQKELASSNSPFDPQNVKDSQ